MQHHTFRSESTPHLVRRSFPGGSRASQRVNLGLAIALRPFLHAWSRFPDLPWPYGLVDHLGHVPSRAAGTRRETVRIGGRPAEITRTPRSRRDRVLVYLHGGAFLVGGRRLHRSLVSHIAHASEATAIAIEYRKLPKHPIAHAIDDTVAAYRELLESGTPADRISFVGDSAGGFLTFAATAEAIRIGLPSPAAIVALSPLTSFDSDGVEDPSARRSCSVFPPDAIPAMIAMARRAHERTARTQSLVELRAPADLDLEGFPRTLIQASSTEVLSPDAELMAARLAAAGVPCELEIWDRQPHVFQASMDVAPEANEAIARIGLFLKDVFEGA